jgi:putative transcriptional regulator
MFGFGRRKSTLADDVRRAAKEAREAMARRERATRLRTVREGLGLSQDAFAARYGLPLEQVAKVEAADPAHVPDTAAKLLLAMICAEPEMAAELVARKRGGGEGSGGGELQLA